MVKYKKKPVIVDVIKWDGKNLLSCITFMGQHVETEDRVTREKFDDYAQIVKEQGLKIHTLEGTMIAEVGDYITKGVKGEFYPCKPDIFELTYEML